MCLYVRNLSVPKGRRLQRVVRATRTGSRCVGRRSFSARTREPRARTSLDDATFRGRTCAPSSSRSTKRSPPRRNRSTGSEGPRSSPRNNAASSSKPQAGRSWGSKANRLRTNYTRKHAVRHWLAFYDTHDKRLWGHTRPRKRSHEVLEVLKRIRRRCPIDQRNHLILDDFSAHGTPTVCS